MNTIDILKGIFGNNATGSRGLEKRQRRSAPQSPKDMAEAIEDILGVGRDRDRRQQRQPEILERPPQRRQQPIPRMDVPSQQSTSRGRASSSSGGLGDLLGEVFGRSRTEQPAPRKAPQQQQQPHSHDHGSHDQGVLLIRAMCNAAKVDGNIDQAEQEAILSRLGNVTQEEIDFVRKELAAPLDIDAFCRCVPECMASDIYGFSVMAIALDTIREAAYLGRLAGGLRLDTETCNQLHQKLGAPVIFG